MHQVFSELKLINLNTEEMKTFSSSSISNKDGMQIDEEQTDKIPPDEVPIIEQLPGTSYSFLPAIPLYGFYFDSLFT
jgi:hypothetical protein